MFAAQSRQTFSGTITDDECRRADHSGMRMHLPPRKCVDAISRRVRDFRGGVAANDDQLLLVISHLDLSGTSGATATESVPGVDIATAA